MHEPHGNCSYYESVSVYTDSRRTYVAPPGYKHEGATNERTRRRDATTVEILAVEYKGTTPAV